MGEQHLHTVALTPRVGVLLVGPAAPPQVLHRGWADLAGEASPPASGGAGAAAVTDSGGGDDEQRVARTAAGGDGPPLPSLAFVAVAGGGPPPVAQQQQEEDQLQPQGQDHARQAGPKGGGAGGGGPGEDCLTPAGPPGAAPAGEQQLVTRAADAAARERDGGAAAAAAAAWDPQPGGDEEPGPVAMDVGSHGGVDGAAPLPGPDPHPDALPAAASARCLLDAEADADPASAGDTAAPAAAEADGEATAAGTAAPVAAQHEPPQQQPAAGELLLPFPVGQGDGGGGTTDACWAPGLASRMMATAELLARCAGSGPAVASDGSPGRHVLQLMLCHTHNRSNLGVCDTHYQALASALQAVAGAHGGVVSVSGPTPQARPVSERSVTMPLLVGSQAGYSLTVHATTAAAAAANAAGSASTDLGAPSRPAGGAPLRYGVAAAGPPPAPRTGPPLPAHGSSTGTAAAAGAAPPPGKSAWPSVTTYAVGGGGGGCCGLRVQLYSCSIAAARNLSSIGAALLLPAGRPLEAADWLFATRMALWLASGLCQVRPGGRWGWGGGGQVPSSGCACSGLVCDMACMAANATAQHASAHSCVLASASWRLI